MNRTKIYVLGLVGFLVMWGVFGFAAAVPRGELNLQATVPVIVSTPVPPEGKDSVGIPVTGEPEPLWMEILGFYGLIGLAALFLILALLSFANQSTTPYARHTGPPSEKKHKH